MRRKLGMAFLALLAAVAIGCQGSEDKPAEPAGGDGGASSDAAANENAAGSQPQPGEGVVVQGAAVENDPAAAAAYQFLEACRRGEDESALKTLTPRAQQRIAEFGRGLGLPARDDMAYRVDEVHYMDASTAGVLVTQMQFDAETKQTIDDNLLVGVIRVDQAWRVQAMSLPPYYDGGDWVRIDFEKPEEIEGQIARAREAAVRHLQAEARAQANATDAPSVGANSRPPAGHEPGQAGMADTQPAAPAIAPPGQPAARAAWNPDQSSSGPYTTPQSGYGGGRPVNELRR